MGDIHPNEIIKVKTNNNSIVYPAQFDCDSFIPESLNKIDEKFLNYFVKPINQNGYFFRDFILPSNDFKNKKDISGFYVNFGKIIPFLLFFRAVDQHIENVICNKQYPVFFDLETYAVPELLDEKYSIFNTGLITESKDVNIGSLDGESGKIKSFFVPILEFDGNNPKLKWVSNCKKQYFNRPTLNAGRVFLRDFLQYIVKGFEEGTKLLNKNKNFLLKETKSSNAYTRIILRPTSIYFILQQKVFFPHIFLQKGFSLENFFIRELKENKIYVQCNIDMDALLKYEVDSLLNGQIPVFYMKINDNLIYDAFRNVIGRTKKKPSDYIIDQSSFLDSFLSETLENIKKSV